MNPSLTQLWGQIRRYPFITVCSLVVVLLGAANYTIWSQHAELAAGHQTIQRSGEDMLLSLTSHSRVTTELASVNEALAFIDHHLVNEADLAENLGYFYQLETSSRLHYEALSQLSSAPAAPDQTYKSVPFTLRTSGSYRQIMRFLRELETGPRLVRITRFTLTQGPVVNDSVTVSLDLTLEMLARP